jgi:hypothetical protein
MTSSFQLSRQKFSYPFFPLLLRQFPTFFGLLILLRLQNRSPVFNIPALKSRIFRFFFYIRRQATKCHRHPVAVYSISLWQIPYPCVCRKEESDNLSVKCKQTWGYFSKWWRLFTKKVLLCGVILFPGVQWITGLKALECVESTHKHKR